MVHGHRRAFIKTGSGPALLLLHGLGCDHTTWLPVIAALSRRYTVIAPDLLGHGRSDKPRADYSALAQGAGSLQVGDIWLLIAVVMFFYAIMPGRKKRTAAALKPTVQTGHQ